MKTHQEILDIVVPAMIAQGAPSYDVAAGVCRYRGPEGRKCAAGVLIPDEDYRPEMEGRNSDYLSIPEANSGFLRQLQVNHDDATADGHTGREWLRVFLDFTKRDALKWGITWRKEWVCP